MSENKRLISVAEDGNTDTSSFRDNSGKTQIKNWFMTLNNYTDDEYKRLSVWFRCHSDFILCKEIGKEKGVPHLHAVVLLKKRMYLTGLKKINNRANWGKLRNKEAAWEYCKKDNDYVTNVIDRQAELLAKLYDNVKWKDWQQDLLDIINKDPDDRTVVWIWDKDGNIGKSFLCKYLCMKENAILANGKGSDIYYQLKTWLEEITDSYPRVAVVDVPRGGNVDYQAIEGLKNGIVNNSKYESGKLIFDRMHVVVFANREPDRMQLSEDRWNVYYVAEDKLWRQ